MTISPRYCWKSSLWAGEHNFLTPPSSSSKFSIYTGCVCFSCSIISRSSRTPASKSFMLHNFTSQWHICLSGLSLFEEVKRIKLYLSGCGVCTDGYSLSRHRRGYRDNTGCLTPAQHAPQHRQPQSRQTSQWWRICSMMMMMIMYNVKLYIYTKEQKSRPSFLCSNASDIWHFIIEFMEGLFRKCSW